MLSIQTLSRFCVAILDPSGEHNQGQSRKPLPQLRDHQLPTSLTLPNSRIVTIPTMVLRKYNKVSVGWNGGWFTGFRGHILVRPEFIKTPINDYSGFILWLPYLFFFHLYDSLFLWVGVDFLCATTMLNNVEMWYNNSYIILIGVGRTWCCDMVGARGPLCPSWSMKPKWWTPNSMPWVSPGCRLWQAYWSACR